MLDSVVECISSIFFKIENVSDFVILYEGIIRYFT